VVERQRGAPVEAQEFGRQDPGESLEAVEERVVLLHQVVERHADRERDHDGVDALGADRKPADEGREERGEQQRNRHREPPRPAEADVADGAAPEDRQRVAGAAGNRHLRQRHHARVAGKEGQRQGDDPEGERLSADLEGEERRRHPGIDQQRRDHHQLADR
jgi:hypothetical protein